MLNPVVSCIVYAAEMLISYVFFSRIAEKKFKDSGCMLAGLILFEISSLLNLLFQNNIWVNTATFILVNIAFSALCFQIRPLSAICYAVILDAFSFALELAAIFLLSAFVRGKTLDYNNNPALLLVIFSTSKTLYFLTCLILSGIVTPKAKDTKISSNLFFYPISATVCLGIFWIICAQEGISYEVQFLLAISSFIIFGSTILLFITYQHQIEASSEYIRLKSEYERLQTEKSYYDILEQQNQNLMIYAHDAKNHLAAIQMLSSDPAINSYITKLSDQLKDYSKICHSGNMMLDVMINKYVLDCSRRSLRFDYNVRSCNLIGLEDIDLVAILGNLMDNAMTSAQNSKGKYLSLETTLRNGYNIIVISNSCDTPPSTYGGYLVTSKEDKKLHGYGLKSVSKVLKKYQGDFSWEYNDKRNVFITTVMIGNSNDH